MGKSRKARIPNYHHHDGPNNNKSAKKMKNFSKTSTKNNKNDNKSSKDSNKNAQRQKQNARPVIPFQETDRVLLVGEGDFSFALSLATNHGCKRIVATSYDAEDALHQKYPQAKHHIEKLRSIGSNSSSGGSLSSSSVGLKRKREETLTESNEEAIDSNGESCNKKPHSEGAQDRTPNHDQEPPQTQNGHHRQQQQQQQQQQHATPKVLCSIDARKLGSPSGGGKLVRTGFPRITPLRRNREEFSSKSPPGRGRDAPRPKEGGGGPWDVICFNFPHVGGISTDVNRQVRANQELLVSFFKACVPLLSPPLSPEETEYEDEDEEDEFQYGEDEDGDDDDDNGVDNSQSRGSKKQKPRTEPGQVIVTIFEGEPYTLWNIRDLARHAGLRVVTSFKFPWASYPGYSHARTLGEVEGRDGRKGSGWKGEDREARSYVFERKDYEGGEMGEMGKGKKKGGRDMDDSD